MTWLEALILGIIQGLTEFLPVSSSGHLELGSVILGLESSSNLLFAVIVHAATALSTIVVFWKDIVAIIRDLLKFKWNDSWVFAIQILISMVPVAIIAIKYDDEIEVLFSGNLLLVGSALCVTAVLLLLTHFKKDDSKPINYLFALIIGVAQAIAVIPGISRSGATIATALLLGVSKTTATRFSFLMVLIPILGAGALKLKDYFENPSISDSLTFGTSIVGFLAAFISGFIACKWMISIVRKGKLTYFAAYCLAVGIIAILFFIL